MKNKKILQKILFEDNARDKLLHYFNKTIDEEGFIVENGTKDRVLSFDGNEVQQENFGGILKGSEIFIKSDISSIVKFIKKTA